MTEDVGLITVARTSLYRPDHDRPPKALTTECGSFASLEAKGSETGKAAQSFGLDPNGNRTSDANAAYTVLDNGNRLVTRNGVASTYDAAGNLLGDQARLNGATVTRSFNYSPAGHLRTVSINGSLVATYSYDASGLRTKKVLANPPANTPATTLYRYDPNRHLSEEIAGSGPMAGTTLVTYVWQDDVPAAVIYAPGTPSNTDAQERIVYLHPDHLNTPRKASDAQGKIVWTWESDAFGSSAPNEDPGTTTKKTTINLRFAGQYFDAESGLHYNDQRYYDPQVGRYTQSDPIGLGGGVNTYAYVAGNPLSYRDPQGLDPWFTDPTLNYNVGWPIQYAPNSGQRAPAIEPHAQCLQRCLGMSLTITGALSPRGSPTSAHPRGDACDFGCNTNPEICRTPKQTVSDCALSCGFTHGLFHAPPHWHFQLGPGASVPALVPATPMQLP